MKRPRKPLLLYDGDCAFCRAWIERWRRTTGDEVEYASYQEAGERFPEIAAGRFAEAVHLIESDGRWSNGAEAVFRSLAHGRGARAGAGAWLYRNVPPFAAASEWLYRIVARNRHVFSTLTRAIWGEHVVPPGQALTNGIFLRALGVVYVMAFISLWTQIHGLVGARGIYPVEGLLAIVRERGGPAGLWFYPTLCWLSPSDGFLHLLCGLGTLSGLLLALGLWPLVGLAVAWVAYLSLATVGQDFLWFQWDGLLLETGLIAMLLAPWQRRLRGASDPAPSRIALFLIRWLLFRFMVSSAIVKIASGDPTWHALTALQYHYETQPLPPWSAWYVHHLPAGFHWASAAGMFAIEGIVPFLILAPRRIRFAAAGAMAALQLVIFTTGNYGFFNGLTLALCLTLLDDAVWPRRWRERGAGRGTGDGRWPTSVVAATAALLFLLSLVPFFGALRWSADWLGPMPTLYGYQAPLRAVNSYGLFAVMTTQRPEIVVEGSLDGREWKAYEFRWKPGDVRRRPEFVAPHMPRLDWQMWFAALNDARREPWFARFCERVLQDSPPVLALLRENPFPGRPPRYLRATLYDYRFADPATRRETGAWWTRRALGPYTPVLTLENGRLAVVELGPMPR